MADKIATREAYGNALASLGEKYTDFVVLDADLAAATKTGVFKKKYPERFFDCGIAEADMVGVAAGLAASGKAVFASSFAMFAAGRAFEQIRNSVGYPHLNVKIGATHAGISVGEDGATHQCNDRAYAHDPRYDDSESRGWNRGCGGSRGGYKYKRTVLSPFRTLCRSVSL